MRVTGYPVPVVSAVGHEPRTAPLCDLAADVRASTPTAAARLVVPDLGELFASHSTRCARGARPWRPRSLERHPTGSLRTREAPPVACALSSVVAPLDDGAKLRALSPLATLERGYADRPHQGAVVPLRRRWRPATTSTSAWPRAASTGSRRGARIKFEEAERELGADSRALASGNVPLDDAVALGSEAKELYRALPRAAGHGAGQARGARAPSRGREAHSAHRRSGLESRAMALDP